MKGRSTTSRGRSATRGDMPSSGRSGISARSIVFYAVITVVVVVNLALLVHFEQSHRDMNSCLSLSSSMMKKDQKHQMMQPTTTAGEESDIVAHLSQMLLEESDGNLNELGEHHPDLYGNKPRFLGLEESCKARTDDQPLALAGLMETDLNWLFDILTSNCMNPNDEAARLDSIKWAPDWGRQAAIPQEREHLGQIPVVIVRDPYTWLQRVCRHRRTAVKQKYDVCPQLKRNPAEHHNKTYDNVLHLWNTYYDMYLQTSHPRIMVRYEDIQLFPKQVVKSLCSCMGGTIMKPNFDYHLEDDTLNDKFTEHLQAMKQRRSGLTSEDLNIARDTLSKGLLRTLGYVHVAGGFVESSTYEAVLSPEDIAKGGVGKERLVELLNDAKIPITKRLLDALPTWQRVVDLYGPVPILHNLEESCSKHDQTDFVFAPSGMFNSGTNALYSVLMRNCPIIGEGDLHTRRIRWQVPWGKHESPHFKRTKSTVTKDQEVAIERILPVVTIRDPYFWMQSMCRRPYETRRPMSGSHCPNLVAASQEDLDAFASWKRAEKAHFNTTRLEKADGPTSNDRIILPIRVNAFGRTMKFYFDSMIDYWMEWHNTYRNWNETRILIRVEDLVYHPKEVVSKLCECAGGKVSDPFEYQAAENNKQDPVLHGYVNLLIRYAEMDSRSSNMTSEDLAFAKERLESDDLMEYFGYRYHPSMN